ncbi:MAG: FecR domain-containing protein [Leptospirales bacterium]|nr:FecR domain-containing protein [Leptospirales bacterium]
MKSKLSMGLIALVIMSAACGKQQSQVKEQDVNIARLTFMTGKVTATTAGTEKTLNVGDLLQQGDKIVTGSDSTAEIFIKGQGIVRLAAQTEMTLASIQENMKTQINVQSGSTAFFLKKVERAGEFTVQTPTAIAGVRGTTFMVAVDNASTSRVSLYNGAVQVQNDKGKTVILDKPGELTVRSGQDISENAVRPLSKESLTAIQKLAVFQKNSIMEYNSLLEEIKTTDAIKGVQINESVSDKFAQLKDESGRGETAERVRRADENTIKRDTKQDPLKIQPNKTF